MAFIGSMKIGKRLALGFALILAFSIVITAIGIWRLDNVSTATREMMKVPLLKERLIGDWYANLASGIRRTSAIAKSSDPALGPYFAEDAAASSKSSSELQKKVETLLSNDEEKALFTKIGELRKAYLSSRDEINKAKAAGNVDDATRLLDKVFTPAANAYQDTMRQLVEVQRRTIDDTAREIDGIAAKSRTLLLVLEGLILVLGIICAYYLTLSITRPLKLAVTISRRVADGDLSSEIAVTSRDETGELLQALKDMNDKLGGTVGNIRTASEAVASAAGQIASGNMDLSSRTEEQAASIEQTAASMAGLTETVSQNADNARQATSLAGSAREMTESGRADVAAMVQTVNEVNAESRKIAEITGMIEGIAFQTNILALNAAVEAARAGEQGRGFAVVAGEVRSLAQRASGAAKEIKELIETSTGKVQVSAQQAEGVSAAMERVSVAIERVSDIIGEISAASDEQSKNLEQVSHAIAQIDQVTQQNASLVEESAAAAQALREQAVGMKDDVMYFKIAGQPVPGRSLIALRPAA
ncbi:methyl-accepting chemotaxis protein [Cupriavidus sp. YR651]|uniref:methyl-accepting chemotaxis protein n=1 Tax=Cupriavidus sp. YR651 TaxID=1855315 RepID=UPI000882FA84|nr:methyl-accepting chemotaxis protein [Cupriavidus sp. YR651]SDC83272.1 methyl-accepting chemotaxis protein [Cupriavidus sp. YR651]